MWNKTSKWNWLLEIPLIAQTVISLTCSNFSNYFEKLWCIISSSFAFPGHFSFHFLLVDAFVTCPCHKRTSLTPSQTPTDCSTDLCDCVLVSAIKLEWCVRLYLCALTQSFTFHTISQPGRHKRETHRVTHRVSQFPWCYDIESVRFFFSSCYTMPQN